MNIVDLIRKRMDTLGFSNKELANATHCTESQLSLFLRQTDGSVSLKTNQLNSCFDELGVNLDPYIYSTEIANAVADIMIKENKTEIEVMKMEQNDMIGFLQKIGINQYTDDILTLIPANTIEDYDRINKSKLVDIEFSFPFFRTLIVHMMLLKKGKITKNSQKATGSVWADFLKKISTEQPLSIALTGALGIISPITLGLIAGYKYLLPSTFLASGENSIGLSKTLIHEITRCYLEKKDEILLSIQ